MASTDTRSGFRLPWSSDRSHDQQPADADEPVADGDGSEAEAVGPDGVAWPETDFNARLGLTSQPRPADPSETADEAVEAADAAHAVGATPPATAPEEPAMLDQHVAPAPVQPALKKPSKLMADLSAAIRATTEAAREQALAQVDADVAKVVEEIRAGSKDGEDALKVQADADIASIREWSRGEIARIKEATERKIDTRKTSLAAETEAHAAAIEGRVAEVERTVDAYRADMAAYADRLGEEQDPALLATMAEAMPEPPSLEVLADLGNLAWAVEVVDELVEEVTEPEAELEAEAVAEVVAFTEGEITDGSETQASFEAEAEPVAELEADAIAETFDAEPVVADVEGVEAQPDAIAGTIEADAVAESEAEAEAGTIEPAAEAATGSAWGDPAGTAWGDEGASWRSDGTAVAVDDDGPRWAAGETPEGFPTTDEAGDPVDRGAIMAALEAAAEAVVAAESAAESAGQAEAAADVAETAAELLKGRVSDDEFDPEAHAAMVARVDAGGVEESYTDRLAKLLPTHGDGAGGSEPRSTQVVVSGLVSVASIASFKRYLGKIGGVQGVTVASGPEGEFVFNVTHLPDVSFRDALPTMPGFAARVTSAADGVVQVTARDPEAEG